MKYLNSKEVAMIMGVHVSTVKRWTDAGKFPCYQTPGGHRKFTLSHLNQFLAVHKKKTNKVNLIELNGIADKMLIHNIENCAFDELKTVFFESAIAANEHRLNTILTGLYLKGAPLYMIYDKLVLPIMHQIGSLWVHGSITISEEHLATEAVRRAIYDLGESFDMVLSISSPVAFCFSVLGDEHELPLIMVKQILELNKIKTFNLGRNLPVGSFIELTKKIKPSIIIISANYVENTNLVNKELRKLIHTAKEIKTSILAGGNAIGKINKRNRSAIREIKNMHDLSDYTVIP